MTSYPNKTLTPLSWKTLINVVGIENLIETTKEDETKEEWC